MNQMFFILLDYEYNNRGHETSKHVAFPRSNLRIQRLTTAMYAAG